MPCDIVKAMKGIRFQSRMLYKRRRRFNFTPYLFIFLMVGICIAALLSGLWYFANLRYWQVSRISIMGNETIDKDSLNRMIEELLSGRFLFFVPRSQYFFLSESSLGGALKGRFPKIRNISVTKTFPDSLDVRLQEREIFIVYCFMAEHSSPVLSQPTPSAPPSLNGGQTSDCFYVDRDGVVFETPVTIAGSAFPMILDDETKDFSPGASIVSGEVLLFLERARVLLKDKLQVGLRSLTLSKDIPKDYLIETGGGYYLIVSRDQDQSGWLSSLKTLLETRLKDKVSEVDYIDLRFGSKIFYKLKGGAQKSG